jgi:hypothetical protein
MVSVQAETLVSENSILFYLSLHSSYVFYGVAEWLMIVPREAGPTEKFVSACAPYGIVADDPWELR